MSRYAPNAGTLLKVEEDVIKFISRYFLRIKKN